jgi:hypothetical protein
MWRLRVAGRTAREGTMRFVATIRAVRRGTLRAAALSAALLAVVLAAAPAPASK